jgi:Tfp pilus assembly protein PilV
LVADIAFVQRLRQNEGFGLIELLLAMTTLNIGILAIVAAFNSGALALSRASKASTATAIADTQMELFRGLKYLNIVQTTSAWNSAAADSTWTADTVYQTYMKTPVSPQALIATQSTCPNTNANSCNPEFTTNGPDGRSYRVDTYMYYDQPTGGEQIKTITVVVRDSNKLGGSLARETSVFDIATGS